MSRSTVALESGSQGSFWFAAGFLLLLIGGLACLMLQPVLQTESRPADPAPVVAISPATVTLMAPPTPMPQQPLPAARLKVAVAATHPRDGMASRPSDLPYRFVGKSAAGAASGVVLFGRGRVVTLHGPGPLDDEYVVEAFFDDFLVVRHLPTGGGKFLAMTRRQPVDQPTLDPEVWPRD